MARIQETEGLLRGCGRPLAKDCSQYIIIAFITKEVKNGP